MQRVVQIGTLPLHGQRIRPQAIVGMPERLHIRRALGIKDRVFFGNFHGFVSFLVWFTDGRVSAVNPMEPPTTGALAMLPTRMGAGRVAFVARAIHVEPHRARHWQERPRRAVAAPDTIADSHSRHRHRPGKMARTDARTGHWQDGDIRIEGEEGLSGHGSVSFG